MTGAHLLTVMCSSADSDPPKTDQYAIHASLLSHSCFCVLQSSWFVEPDGCNMLASGAGTSKPLGRIDLMAVQFKQVVLVSVSLAWNTCEGLFQAFLTNITWARLLLLAVPKQCMLHRTAEASKPNSENCHQKVHGSLERTNWTETYPALPSMAVKIVSAPQNSKCYAWLQWMMNLLSASPAYCITTLLS